MPGRHGFAALAAVALLLLAPASRAQGVLTFATPPQTLPLGQPGTAMRVARVDGGGQPVTSGSLTVRVAGSVASGQFSLDPEPGSGWTSTLDLSIAAGASMSAPFFYRDSSAGAVELEATASGWTSARQTQTVSALALESDFESGTLLSSEQPPGPWTGANVGIAQNSLAADAAAAHRGALGLRLDDADAQSGSGGQNFLTLDFAPVQGDYHVRFWFRLAAANALQNVTLVQLGNGQSNNSVLASVFLRPAGVGLWLGGYDAADYLLEECHVDLGVGSWHLVELAALGLGTTQGRRQVWIDGIPRASGAVLDWGGSIWRTVRINLGEPYSERGFTGRLDFDDVRAGSRPHASRLDLVAPGSAFAARCVPLTVALRDSVAGAPAPAPYPVEVRLGVSGVVGVSYCDPECVTECDTVTIGAGETEVAAGYRADAPGGATLSAGHPDFLPDSVSLVLTQDTGPLPDGGETGSDGGGAGEDGGAEGGDGGAPHDGGSTADAGGAGSDAGADAGVDAGVESPEPAVARIARAEHLVDPGDPIVLDGAGSTPSPGASLIEWRWSQPEGPTGVVLGETPAQHLVLREPGKYRFALQVVDSAGSLSAPAEVELRVRGEPSAPPALYGCGAAGAPAWPLAAIVLGLALTAMSRRRQDP